MSNIGTKSKTAAEYWREVTRPFCGADDRKSYLQLATAATLFLLSWTSMYLSLVYVGYWLTLIMAIPTAAFVVFLFMIQHDCGHGSYFKSRWMRDTVGYFIGVLTLTPYEYWRRTHAYHHAHSGDLDFRGVGDIKTMTKAEYLSRPLWRRVVYRVYRNPLTLLALGPIYQFVIKHRYPWDIPADWKQAWRGVWMTNLGLAVVLLAMAYSPIGLWNFFLIQGPVTVLACSAGVFLFYVQHQYEDSYWHRHKDWDYYEAAIRGSSHLVLPKPLQWLTANIGIHHVHHLNSQIPNYKLEECMMAAPELQTATRITLRDCFRLFNLTLFDEEKQRMISFRELRRDLTSTPNPHQDQMAA